MTEVMASLGELAALAGGICTPGADDLPVVGIGTDSRLDLGGHVFVAIEGDQFDGHEFLVEAMNSGAIAVLISQGRQLPQGMPAIEVDDTRAALTRMATAWRQRMNELQVVAITGTVGKTSTKDLLAAMCQQSTSAIASPRSFNNELGVPLTVLSVRPGHRVLVAEVGINAPGEMAPLATLLKPDVAVVTVVGRGHLEGLGSIEQVAREKYALCQALGPQGVAILRQQSLDVPDHPGATLRFGEDVGAEIRLGDRGPGWFEAGGRKWECPLPGRHAALNATAALAAARQIGIPDQAIAEALAGASPSPQRLVLKRCGQVRLIDDTWNANPESVEAALETLPELVQDGGPLTVILGDMRELGAASAQLHEELLPLLVAAAGRTPLSHLILVGSDMSRLAAGATRRLPGIPVHSESRADDDAIRRIVHRIPSHGTVLVKGSRGLHLERIEAMLESGEGAA